MSKAQKTSEAKYLSHEERVIISTYTPSLLVCKTSRCPELKAAHAELCSNLTPVGKKDDYYFAEAWNFLNSVLTAAIRRQDGYTFSLAKPDYVKANKKAKSSLYKLSAERMRTFILSLQEFDNSVQFYKGFHMTTKGHNSGTKFQLQTSDWDYIQSSVTLSDQWLKRFDTDKIKPVLTESDRVEVRDSKTKDPLIMKGRSCTEINVKKQKLKIINSFLQSSRITLGGNPAYVAYKIIHIDDLESYGRLHTMNGFQNIDATYRPRIQIDGLPTTEVDIVAQHISLLASRLGIKLHPEKGEGKYDPYDLADSMIVGNKKDVRSFLKVCMLAILNTETKAKSISSVNNKMWTELKKIKCQESTSNYPSILWSSFTATDIVEGLIERNHFLKPALYNKGKPLWKTLMYQDSSIALLVSERMTELGIPTLLYHDSFLCPTVHKDKLKSVMKESWLKVVGNTDNFRLDVKHENHTPSVTYKHNLKSKLEAQKLSLEIELV